QPKPLFNQPTSDHKAELAKSEPPDDSGRGAVIILIGAGVMGVHVIALHTPGKILKKQFVIKTATHIDFERIVNESIGRAHMPDTSHRVDEGAQFPHIYRKTRAAEYVVLPNPAAVETAAIDDKSKMRKAGEGEILERSVPATIT